MKAWIVNHRLFVLCLSLASFVLFTGFGSCGYEVHPPSHCKTDSDCPSSHYCDISKARAVSNDGDDAPVPGTKAQPGSLGVKCVDAEPGSGLKTRCAVMPPDDGDDDSIYTRGVCRPNIKPLPPKRSCRAQKDCAPNEICQLAMAVCPPNAKCAPSPTRGICIKRKRRRRRRRRRQIKCESNRDCAASQFCKISVTNCTKQPNTMPGGTGDSDDEPGLMPPACRPLKTGVCVDRPKKPQPQRCSGNRDCRSNEICKIAVPEPTHGSGHSGSSDAGEPVHPTPPLPPGICVPAPPKPKKRSCYSKSDCKRGEICKTDGSTDPEPAPAPPKSSSKDDDGDDDECVEPPPAGYCAPDPKAP